MIRFIIILLLIARPAYNMNGGHIAQHSLPSVIPLLPNGTMYEQLKVTLPIIPCSAVLMEDYELYDAREEFKDKPLNKQTLMQAIEYINIQHPGAVYAHSLRESGHLKSKLTKNGNNLFGMKLPRRRPTLAIGVLYGHARYAYWVDSLLDYYIWQKQREVTDGCYSKYLRRRGYFGS